MSTTVRVAAFVVALVAAFAVAWGAGRLVGPIDVSEPAQHEQTNGEMADMDGMEGGSHDD